VFQIPSGKTFSNFYELGKLVGHGSFGAVFECKHSSSTKGSSWIKKFLHKTPGPRSGSGSEKSHHPALVVKVLNKEIFVKNSWTSRFGSRGLELALNCDHPNIVRYYQFLEDDERNFAVMQRYFGNDLFDWIKQQPKKVSEESASSVMHQILSAISKVHELECIHCDIKAENFIFEDKQNKGKLKLVDFGNALADDSRPIAGTTGYCAPEVFTGNFTSKIDIFSAGVILFVLLTKEMPFDSRSIEQYKISIERAKTEGLWKVLNLRGDRLRDASENAKDLLSKMLCLDPDDRISSSEALTHPWFPSSHTVENRPI
jgi:calcium-dependent protein kinase